jgi:Domain of unknown function (DUF4132)
MKVPPRIEWPSSRVRCAAGLREQGESRRKDAPADRLPTVLRDPPWLGTLRAAEPPVLALEALARPSALRWAPGEEAQAAAYEPALLGVYKSLGSKRTERILEAFAISPAAWDHVLAGGLLRPGDVTTQRAAKIDLMLGLPDAAGCAVWNSCPPELVHAYGPTGPSLLAVLAKWGPDAIAGFERYLEAHVQDGLEVARVVDSIRVAAVVLHALRNRQQAKSAALAWLRAHAATASAVAIPMAFGNDRKQRGDAAYALRWLAQNGFESTVRDAAASHGRKAVAALEILLDADPLLALPARMPKLPSFFVASSLRRPVLRSGGAALPVTAMEHIGSMLAISTLEAPYVGLDLVREACTPVSLAEFAWDVFEAWQHAGSPGSENWAFHALGLLGNDETARRLAPLIRAWPGEAKHQRAVKGLDLLAAIGTDVALMHLNGIATHSTHKPLQRHAKEKIAAVADARGLTATELADRLVPDLGLDEQGRLVLDFGPRQFFIGFDESLKPFVKDTQGARLKDLPKPLKSDDAALADAATDRFKQMKKDAKAVASLQVVRLELAMIDRRRWSATDFKLFFLEHPLMRHLAARLLWGVYAGGGTLQTAFQTAFRVAEDWTLADAEDNTTTLSNDASVGVVHVLEMPQPMQAAFDRVFTDYKILQPFKQLGRETYTLTEVERNSSRITRFEHKVVATGSVVGLINRGWERGEAEDGWVGRVSKRVSENLEVELELDPGTIVGDISHQPKQKLPGITLRKVGTWGDDGRVTFDQLHPIIASEVLRDVELLAPYKDA